MTFSAIVFLLAGSLVAFSGVALTLRVIKTNRRNRPLGMSWRDYVPGALFVLVGVLTVLLVI